MAIIVFGRATVLPIAPLRLRGGSASVQRFAPPPPGPRRRAGFGRKGL